MPTLKLGVVDVPYSAVFSFVQDRKNFKARMGKEFTDETTGDVAEILERKYHIMETFVELHMQEISEAVEKAYAGAIENMMGGNSPIDANPLSGAFSALEEKFRLFLSHAEIESMGIPGVPTEDALKGVSPRFKSGRGPRRPSFVRSGTYQSAFRVWTDEDRP